MIVNRIIRFFAGTVRVRAAGKFCERLINLAVVNGITMYQFEKRDNAFEITVSASDYKRLTRLVKASEEIKLIVLKRNGFLFWAERYKKRFGIMLGIILLIAALAVSQRFVWEINVNGNSKVRTEEILYELEQIGVKRFAYIPSIDFRMKKQEALLRLPRLSWLTINQSGSKLYVEVSERKMPPKLIDETTPCDIVAAKTGLILYMEVYSGTKVKTEKHTVQKGETIVRGSYTDKAGNSHSVHSAAKVIAQTQFDKKLSIDMENVAKEYTGEITNRHYLKIGSFALPLFIATEIGGSSDVVKTEKPLTLFGKELPIGITTLSYRFYEAKPQKLEVAEAREILKKAFLDYEKSELRSCVIVSRDVKEQKENGVFTMITHYVCEEDIALKKVREAE